MSVTLNNGDIYGALINGSPITKSINQNCFQQALTILQNQGGTLTQNAMTNYLQNNPQGANLRIEHQKLTGLDDYRIYLGEHNIGTLSKTSSGSYSFCYSSRTKTSNGLFLNIPCLII